MVAPGSALGCGTPRAFCVGGRPVDGATPGRPIPGCCGACGISLPEEAERLIVLGFFDDVFARLPLSSLTRRLRSAVVDKLEHRRPVATKR